MLRGSDACTPNSSRSEWDDHFCFPVRNCQPQCCCTNILNRTQLEYSADLFYPFITSWWFQHIWKSQNGNLLQIGMKIKNVWNHHLNYDYALQKRSQKALDVNVVFHCWGFDSSLDSNLEKWLDGFNLSQRYPNQNLVWKGHTTINA